MDTSWALTRLFKKKMALLALVIGFGVTLTMPLTYFFISIYKEKGHAQALSRQLAEKLMEPARENPLFWSYNYQKFTKAFAETQNHISTIRVQDDNLGITDTQSFLRPGPFDVVGRSSVIYNNRQYGYVEVQLNTREEVRVALLLLVVFLCLGLLTGLALYRFPVNIVFRAENEIREAFKKLQLAEENLRKSENKFRSYVNQSIDGIFVIDGTGKYVEVNPAGCKLLRYTEEELKSKTLWEIMDHDGQNKKQMLKQYRQLMSTGRFKGEGVVVDKTGNKVIVEIHAATMDNNHHIGIVRDITSRKLAETELRRSEERFSKAFDASPDLMCIISLHEGKFIHVNENFLYRTGYRADEVLGRPLAELNIWQSNSTLHFTRLAEMVPVGNIEVDFQTKSGLLRAGLFSAEKIEVGGEECLLAVTRDITERKRLQQEVVRLDRLNLVGEMAAGIGHEIRNPMTTARGFIQLLGGKKECYPYREFFDVIIEELDRANNIISEYLSMAKNKRIERKTGNLNNVIKALYPLIRADALLSEKEVALQLGNITEISFDEKEIRQVILNLARNGLEAMNRCGTLTISTYLENNDVVLAIKDEGHGIDPNILDKIGTPFYTTKEQGTGLGLAVCYSIAARHQAAITFDTGETGTTFQVRFQASEQPEESRPA